MAIYTKTGDRGTTQKFTGERVSKSSKLTNTLGSIDELNSFLGVVTSFSQNQSLNGKIINLQKNLLVIGSILAGSKLTFSRRETHKLEREIDEAESKLPVLYNFIIPGGSMVSSLLHYSRTVSRRAERRVVSLSITEKVKPEILKFMNRVSDYLFTLARLSNFENGVKEEIWKTKK